jgi:ubiquinone/menaquinone biosynthesis C-methylase UbiE
MKTRCDVENIDWNQIWSESPARHYSAEDWDERAERFSKGAIDSRYAANFVNFLQPQPQWTVFDMGCGSGTIALPLAKQVQSVTAADFSPKMLAALDQYAKERKLDNITTLKLSWTDNWDTVPSESHDIAIASRSMHDIKDFRGAVEKLINVAKQRVYLALFVEMGPEHDLVYQALGRKKPKTPDYLYGYNIIYQMGIRANINILTDYTTRIYESEEEAISHLAGNYTRDLKIDDIEILKKYVCGQLARDNNGWHLKTPRPYRCAVIWWDNSLYRAPD